MVKRLLATRNAAHKKRKPAMGLSGWSYFNDPVLTADVRTKRPYGAVSDRFCGFLQGVKIVFRHNAVDVIFRVQDSFGVRCLEPDCRDTLLDEAFNVGLIH